MSNQGNAHDSPAIARVLPLAAVLGLSFFLSACTVPMSPPPTDGTNIAPQPPGGPGVEQSRAHGTPGALNPADLPRDEAFRTAVADAKPVAAPEPPREIIPEVQPKAAARYEGTASPGQPITLRADGSTGVGLRYRWVQTQGPPVTLDDPTNTTARLMVPIEARGTLGFSLVVSNSLGMDSIALSIPIEERPKGPGAPLHADAGDDQMGLVGHQITLSGIRSEPRGKIGYRWIQTGGPPARLKLADGYVFSFVPAEQGTYQFTLVVAAGMEVSEPDDVRVVVGSPTALAPVPAPANVPALSPTPTTTPADGAHVTQTAQVAPVRKPESIEKLIRTVLATLPGGPESAASLSQMFDAVISRVDLFNSYDEAFSEISRRLEGIVPQDPARRALWIDRLFTPITARMVEEMRKEGLDLATSEGRSATLSSAQKARLEEIFRAIGQGFQVIPTPEMKGTP